MPEFVIYIHHLWSPTFLECKDRCFYTSLSKCEWRIPHLVFGKEATGWKNIGALTQRSSSSLERSTRCVRREQRQQSWAQEKLLHISAVGECVTCCLPTTVALSLLGLDNFLSLGCPMHCRTLSSIPGLSLVDALPPMYGDQQCPQT